MANPASTSSDARSETPFSIIRNSLLPINRELSIGRHARRKYTDDARDPICPTNTTLPSHYSRKVGKNGFSTLDIVDTSSNVKPEKSTPGKTVKSGQASRDLIDPRVLHIRPHYASDGPPAEIFMQRSLALDEETSVSKNHFEAHPELQHQKIPKTTSGEKPQMTDFEDIIAKGGEADSLTNPQLSSRDRFPLRRGHITRAMSMRALTSGNDGGLLRERSLIDDMESLHHSDGFLGRVAGCKASDSVKQKLENNIRDLGQPRVVRRVACSESKPDRSLHPTQDHEQQQKRPPRTQDDPLAKSNKAQHTTKTVTSRTANGSLQRLLALGEETKVSKNHFGAHFELQHHQMPTTASREKHRGTDVEDIIAKASEITSQANPQQSSRDRFRLRRGQGQITRSMSMRALTSGNESGLLRESSLIDNMESLHHSDGFLGLVAGCKIGRAHV